MNHERSNGKSRMLRCRAVSLALAGSAFVLGCSSSDAAEPSAQPPTSNIACLDDDICNFNVTEDCSCSDCLNETECVTGHTKPVVTDVKPFVYDCSGRPDLPVDVFTVRNDGDKDMKFHSLPSGLLACDPVTVAPGESETVQCSAYGGWDESSWSSNESFECYVPNDDAQPAITVNVSVDALGVTMAAPDSVDFGNVSVGTTESKYVSVSVGGPGAGAYFLPDFGAPDFGFALGKNTYEDNYVPSGTSASIELQFTPTSVGCHTQEVTLRRGGHDGNYLCSTRSIKFSGCGI